MNKNYYLNRTKCIFKNCQCKSHVLLKYTEICAICYHGTCWHLKEHNIEKLQYPKIKKKFIKININNCMNRTNILSNRKFCDKIENLPV